MWYPEDYGYLSQPNVNDWYIYCGNVYTGQTQLSYRHSRMGYFDEGEVGDGQERSPVTYRGERFWASTDNPRVCYRGRDLIHKVGVNTNDRKKWVSLLPNYASGAQKGNYIDSAYWTYNTWQDPTILNDYGDGAYGYFEDYYDPDSVSGSVSACTSIQSAWAMIDLRWDLILNYKSEAGQYERENTFNVKVYECKSKSLYSYSCPKQFNTSITNTMSNIVRQPGTPYSSCYGPLSDSRRTFFIVIDYICTAEGKIVRSNDIPKYRARVPVIMSTPTNGTFHFDSYYASILVNRATFPHGSFPNWNTVAEACKSTFFTGTGNLNWSENKAFCFPTLPFCSTLNYVVYTDRVHVKGYIDGADSPDYPRFHFEETSTVAKENPSAFLGLNNSIMVWGSAKCGNGHYYYSPDFQGGEDTQTFGMAPIWNCTFDGIDGDTFDYLSVSALGFPAQQNINYCWSSNYDGGEVNQYSACIFDWYDDYASSGGIDSIESGDESYMSTDGLYYLTRNKNPVSYFHIYHKVYYRVISPPTFEITLGTYMAPVINAY